MSLILQSPRGSHLVWVSERLPDVPTLTVELADKWYSLFLVGPNGAVERVEFPDDFADHCPNPEAVEQLAERHGWDLSLVAHELIVGRWQVQVCGQ